MGFNYGDYPCSEQYYEESISIPIYPTMTDLQQTKTINAIREIIKS
jgi:dTDP-4-amino-4,6-dideoxygalactose transaminase